VKKSIISGILIFLTGIAIVVLYQTNKSDSYYTQQTKKITETLSRKTEKVKNILEVISRKKTDSDANGLFTNDTLRNISNKEGIYLFCYKNDSLIYWSSNAVPIPPANDSDNIVEKIEILDNGWYYSVSKKKNDLLWKAYILIKNEYFIQNDFLGNSFHKDFEIKEKTNLRIEKTGLGYIVNNIRGEYLFTVLFNDADNKNDTIQTIVGILGVILIFLIFYFIYSLRFIPFLSKYAWVHFISALALVFGVRSFSTAFQWPGFIYQLSIFDPVYFASSWWMPSLGDFIVNAILILFYLRWLFDLLFDIKLKNITSGKIQILVIVYSFISSISAWAIIVQLRMLILDSRISFDLSNLLALDLYSFLGFTGITLLLSHYLITVYYFTQSLFFLRKSTFTSIAITSFIIHAILGCIQYFFFQLPILGMAFPYLIFLSILSLQFNKKREFSFYSLGPALLLVTTFSTYLLFQFNKEKEAEERKMLAYRISGDQDHVAEYLFKDIEYKIKKDEELHELMLNNRRFYPRFFFEKIAQHYFSGYWTKYALKITPFEAEDYININDSANADPELYNYEKNIKEYGRPTTSPSLFYIDNNIGKVNYLAKIEINDSVFGTKYIFIEFKSKIVTQTTGFPELLLDESIKKPADIGSYSYAVFKNNRLNISGGEYIYPLKSQEFSKEKKEIYTIISNEFNHLIYQSPGGKMVVVSRKVLKWLDFLSPFAYLLIYFSAILFVYFVYRYFILSDLTSLQFNLKTRIQLSILFILLVSLIVVGLGINNYVVHQFEKKNRQAIDEKLNSIITELNARFEEDRSQYSTTEEMSFLMGRLSGIFFSDINFYGTDGKLISSSREAIQNEGLLSYQINPTAYSELSMKMQPKYIQREKIGKFEYISAYATFRNENNEVVGYINLPYFLRQKELGEELAASLLALINIYSLLISVSMIITFVIANRLTIPLTLLQDKIGKLRLGRKNEMIEYASQDEIGSLVAEYNRMIKELEASAELLAKSERETAWREMAKQVAHEVKNPLTPMKLSVQHLIKAWEDKRPDFDTRLHKFKDAMIEQIETLSNIASEFSYFAKMPAALKQEIDLEDLLSKTIEFYKNNDDNIRFVFKKKTEQPPIVIADRDQLLRVFNNLFRNAIQSIPEEKEGMIHVTLNKERNEYVISIKDNGNGIPLDIQEKIFEPNFTTKNSGMGLGLAMSKSILENMNGSISFQSNEESGTTFYVRILRYHQN
jgi:signal transduction histidine kinase